MPADTASRNAKCFEKQLDKGLYNKMHCTEQKIIDVLILQITVDTILLVVVALF